jgi:hypothetical protein
MNMPTRKVQKTFVFAKEILDEYQALCDKLGFRMSLRMEYYMHKDLVLLRGYAKKIEI